VVTKPGSHAGDDVMVPRVVERVLTRSKNRNNQKFINRHVRQVSDMFLTNVSKQTTAPPDRVHNAAIVVR